MTRKPTFLKPTRPLPRRRTFALLVDYVVSNYQVSLMRAVERATAELDTSLVVLVGRSFDAPSLGDRIQTQLYELLAPEVVDGIIIVSGCLMNYCGPERLAAYCASMAPIPVCSIAVELPGVPSVLVSNRGGSRALVEHLITAHGTRRIAYIRGPSANRETNDRFDGYREALAAHGLPYDASLVADGDLSMPAGVLATRELFGHGAKFDALVAANDYMAMGALEVFREMGLRVPDDVLLGGFDDATFARFALPALSTVRQPIDRLGRAAVEKLLRLSDGADEPLVTILDADFVSRQSCGCGLGAPIRARVSTPPGSRSEMLRALTRSRTVLTEKLHASVGVPPEAFGGWAERTVAGLDQELHGEEGAFLKALADVLERATPYPDYVDELFKVVSVLRGELYAQGLVGCETIPELEQLWHTGQLLLGNAATNAQGRTKLDLQVVLDAVRAGFERIATSLTLPSLKQAIASTLPDIQINHAYFALGACDADSLVPFLTVARERTSLPPTDAHPSRRLVPPGFFPGRRHSHIVQPLTFEGEWFGIAVMEYTSNETVYSLVREQVSSALKGGALYRTTLQQAAVRERLEHEAHEQEAHIAAQIQSLILPRHLAVEGLTVAARMVPAASIGGDYYDVIPVPGGAWLGIGDVTGHGLFAGLVMMMLQSMVASLARYEPGASPAALFVALNAALRENLRHRLERNDHATLVLVRYDRSGSLVYAGAHEDLVVYRGATRRCELLLTTGVWAGMLDDAGPHAKDETARLAPGDVLVLYSDGLTEALNEKHEQFGIERLCRTVEAHVVQGPAGIVDALLREVAEWQTGQLDDLTVVVARFDGE